MQFSARHGQPDPLCASRLLIDLDHARAIGLHAPHLALRIFETIDLGKDTGLLAPIENRSRRIDARSDHQSSLDVLRLAENIQRRCRWVINRCDTVCEIRDILPLGLWKILKAGIMHVRMRIDEAGNDGFTAAVINTRIGGPRIAVKPSTGRTHAFDGRPKRWARKAGVAPGPPLSGEHGRVNDPTGEEG